MEVARSQASGLLQETPEPLQPGLLAPVRGAAADASQHLEASAHPDGEVHAQLGPLLLEEEFLPRSAHANEKDLRTAAPDGAGALYRFGGPEIAVGNAADRETGMFGEQTSGRRLDHRAAGAE